MIWMGSLLLNALHWLGFLCDEIFFRKYRHIPIKQPIFVLGIPRSGTTFLHRTLAKDSRLTSLTTWQAIFAPSISERLVLGKLAKLFAKGKFSNRNDSGFIARMDSIHKLGWDQPEEDFILLWQLQACFLLFLICPNAKHYWKLGTFDASLPRWYRSSVMAFYRRCIQKHLYCEGPEKRYLSKNPSFTPLIGSISEQFPDARIIACYRTPEEAVPSQLSSLIPGLDLLGYRGFPDSIKVRLIDTLTHYYELVIQAAESGTALPVAQQALRNDLHNTLVGVYKWLSLSEPVVAEQRGIQENREGGSQSNKSKHNYSLAEFNLSSAEIESEFGKLWRKIQVFNNLS